LDNELKNKIVAGYQAWFRAAPSLEEGWIHWSRNGAPGCPDPSGNKATFEMFPDTREYPADIMYPSGYPPLGNGRPSDLFSSRTAAAIDLHCA